MSSKRQAGGLASWALRIAWVALLASGPAIAGAVDDSSAAVRVTATVMAWTAWGIGLVATIAPSPSTLTVVRLLAPVAPVAGVLALLAGAGGVAGAVAVAVGVAVTIVAFAGEVGEAFVQGGAYGDESRYPLRPPVPLLAPIVVAWIVLASAVVTAPLAIAARSWAFGLLAAGIAAGALWLLPRRFHALSRRWLVFVPAGVVVHDGVVLAETVAVRPAQLRSISLALADTEAADLTGPAAGHALEVTLGETITVLRAPTRSSPRGTALHVRAFLVSPSRPGRALAEARRRGIPG